MIHWNTNVWTGLPKLAEQRGWTDFYHVSPRANRESILQHGLQGAEMDSPWDTDRKRKHEQPAGNYFYHNPEDAVNYAWDTYGRPGFPGSAGQQSYEEDQWQWPQPPHDFDDWDAETQQNWQDENEPVPATEDPNGWDVWKVNTRGLPIHRDPESTTVHNNAQDGEHWTPQLLQEEFAENKEYGDWDAQAEEMANYHGTLPVRSYTPVNVEPQRMQLQQHIPSWEMSDEQKMDQLDNRDSYETETLRPWDEMLPRTPQFPAHSSWQFKQADYYHVAPTTERARIQQHGLQPSWPPYSDWGISMKSEDPFPEGVYAFPDDPNRAEMYRKNLSDRRGVGHDIWRIPAQNSRDWGREPGWKEDPDIRGAIYNEQPVMNAEIHSPYEDVAAWPAPQDAHDWEFTHDFKRDVAPYAQQLKNGNPWGIGQPNRVWGAVHEADAATTFNPVAPIDELTNYLGQGAGGSAAGALNPNNPLSGDAAPAANKANPNMNPSLPGAFNNPSNPELNPALPGAATNSANPEYNPNMPGAQNNPANVQYNPAIPGAINNPSSPSLNPAYPGSMTNPSSPYHNPDYPNPDAIGKPPTNLGPDASFSPQIQAAWHIPLGHSVEARTWAPVRSWTPMVAMPRTAATSWHLTDDPNFQLDPTRVPQDNTFAINQRTRPGLYVGDPEKWFNGYNYARPFAAEIEHPDAEQGRWGGEGFIPGEQLGQSQVKRVIPLDEYVRETYHAPGWYEDHFQDPGIYQPKQEGQLMQRGVQYPADYRYSGPDVRDMTPEQSQYYIDRSNRYMDENPDRFPKYDDDGERISAWHIAAAPTHQCPNCQAPLRDNGRIGWSMQQGDTYTYPTWDCPACGFDFRPGVNHPRLISQGYERTAAYWHLTDNPNFQIDPQQVPSDAIAGPDAPQDPGLMVSDDPHFWASTFHNHPEEIGTEYEQSENPRNWAAEIDLSGVPANQHWDTGRGFPERWVNQPGQAQVKRVLPLQDALNAQDAEDQQREQELIQQYRQAADIPGSEMGDSRNFADPTEPRASEPASPRGCTCAEGLKLECPVHGLHATEPADDDLWDWSIPQSNPVGFPQSQPRGWAAPYVS